MRNKVLQLIMRYLITILAILLCCSPVQAEALGKLFFTPEERAALDRERLNGGLPASQASDAPVESVTLNGHIKRSGGKSTVWINGKSQNEYPNGYKSDASKQVKVTEKKNDPGEVAVKLPDSNRTYPLKVGQTLTPGNGEIREGYRPGPKPAAAKPADDAPQSAASAVPSNAMPGSLDNVKK
jgi:hypothetical protein